MEWYLWAFFIGCIVTSVIIGSSFLGRYAAHRGIIHQCKTCNQFVAKGELEKHIIQKHTDRAV